MPSFLNPEQQALAQEIAALLTDRGQTVAVAEATSGGLISAALLWVPGASRYYVLYTLDSRSRARRRASRVVCQLPRHHSRDDRRDRRVDAPAHPRDVVRRRVWSGRTNGWAVGRAV